MRMSSLSFTTISISNVWTLSTISTPSRTTPPRLPCPCDSSMFSPSCPLPSLSTDGLSYPIPSPHHPSSSFCLSWALCPPATHHHRPAPCSLPPTYFSAHSLLPRTYPSSFSSFCPQS